MSVNLCGIFFWDKYRIKNEAVLNFYVKGWL